MDESGATTLKNKQTKKKHINIVIDDSLNENAYFFRTAILVSSNSLHFRPQHLSINMNEAEEEESKGESEGER